MEISAIILLVSIGFAIIMLITFYDSGRKALAIFPDINTVKVIYRDKTASGYSTKSWKTKFGGASRAIDIIVTDKELWLSSFLLLAGITKQHDLLHKIPLNKITSVKEKEGKIVLNFKNAKAESKQVILSTRDNISFLKSLDK
jgi:hypothetical protein